jgi:hypothetical protein
MSKPKLVLPTIRILILPVVAMALQLFMTRYGAGVSPDSVHYLASAENFSLGNGLVHLGNDGNFVPLTLWPPLYPLILAGGSIIRLDPWTFARYLNTILFGLNILLLQTMLYKATNRTWAITLAGTAALLVSPTVLEVHSWVWTEPLAILLGFSSLLLLERYIDHQDNFSLAVASLLMALGILTRYAALAFPMMAVVFLLLYKRHLSLSERFKKIGILSLISFTPLALMMIRNAVFDQEAVGRDLSFNLQALSYESENALEVIARWTIPGRIEEPYKLWLSASVLIIWLSIIATEMWSRREKRRKKEEINDFIPELLFGLIIFSILPMIAVNILFSPGVHIDQRVLSTTYIAGTLLTFIVVHQHIKALLKNKNPLRSQGPVPTLVIKGVLIALMGLILALNVGHSVKWLRNRWEDGLGFASSSWQNSKIIDYLKTNDQGQLLMTHVPDGVYFLTGRKAIMMPRSIDAILALAREKMAGVNQGYEEELWIIYFRGSLRRLQVPAERELKQELELIPIIGWDEGSIYSLPIEIIK